MNYANRTWYGAYDTEDQTGSVIGYLSEFLKKHPEIVANKDAFYKEGGYLNGMYFNNDCIESLENPKNGFFVKEADLTKEQRYSIMQDLAQLHNAPDAKPEALLVVDTLLFGMDVPEMRAAEWTPSKHNVKTNPYKTTRDGNEKTDYTKKFNSYTDRVRADHDKAKQEEQPAPTPTPTPIQQEESGTTYMVVAEVVTKTTQVPKEVTEEIEVEVDGDSYHAYSNVAYERAHARLNGKQYENSTSKPRYRGKKQTQMIANIDSLGLPSGEGGKSNTEIYMYKVDQVGKLAQDSDTITVGTEKTTFGKYLKGEDGCSFNEFVKLLQKKNLTEDEKVKVKATMERLEPLVNDKGQFLKAVPGSKGKMSYLPEGKKNFEQKQEKKTVKQTVTKTVMVDQEEKVLQKKVVEVKGTEAEREAEIARITQEVQQNGGAVPYVDKDDPRKNQTIRDTIGIDEKTPFETVAPQSDKKKTDEQKSGLTGTLSMATLATEVEDIDLKTPEGRAKLRKEVEEMQKQSESWKSPLIINDDENITVGDFMKQR